VCNGGFHQFFSNSTGVLAPEALQAFRAMGLPEWGACLEEAMRFFGSTYPRDRSVRDQLLAQVTGKASRERDHFRNVDDRFFAWLRAEGDPWELAADTYASTIRNRSC